MKFCQAIGELADDICFATNTYIFLSLMNIIELIGYKFPWLRHTRVGLISRVFVNELWLF